LATHFLPGWLGFEAWLRAPVNDGSVKDATADWFDAQHTLRILSAGKAIAYTAFDPGMKERSPEW
jgi:hypothetical protein